jgi:hypothetical protein
MKDIFSGYLPIDQESIKKLIHEGTIAFDTSSLFNLYRYKESTTKEVFTYLEKIKSRLFLPYIVGLEYHNKRPVVLNQQRSIYTKLNNKVDELKKSISEQFLNEQHSSVSFEEVDKIVKHFETEFRGYLKKCEFKHPNFLINDPIRTQIVDIFNNIGTPFNNDALNEIYEVAEQRFDNKIPPGYKDSKNKDKIIKTYGDQIIRSKYSDYIIWHEIIQFGAKNKCPILLITDEVKEDWCWKENGYNLGPRPELITEYNKVTGCTFYFLSLNQFLHYVRGFEKLNISDKAIADIKSTSNISWKDEVKNAVRALGGTVSLAQLYSYIEKNSNKELTKEWKGTVRKTIYSYCSERDVYLGKENLYREIGKSVYQLIEPLE